MTDEPTILVVDDDEAVADTLASLLVQAGYVATTADSGRSALRALGRRPFDLVISDLRMPGMDGIELLRTIADEHPGIPVVMLTAHGTVETAVEAMKLGASDFLNKPFERDEILFVVDKALRTGGAEHDRPDGAGELEPHVNRSSILGSSPQTEKLLDEIDRSARSSATVLIRGESGTGKELVARALHERSPRADEPFVKVHCAALPDTLLESELFGHEKGAFTGATSRKPGRIELADGGTLFLDEIGDISAAAQVSLLRVLQDGEFERVGGTDTLEVDVRFVAATHRNLQQMVREEEFREDLFYRLNVLRIDTTPLRQRPGEVSELAEAFCARLAAENGRPGLEPSEAALERLTAYDWPGNVRQLENIVERLVVYCDGDHIDADLVEAELGREMEKEPLAAEEPGRPADKSTLEDRVRTVEADAIRQTLERCDGNKSQAARVLGISRRTLYYKLEELDIE